MFVASVGLLVWDLIEGEMFDPPEWLDLCSDGGGGRENSEESEASRCDLGGPSISCELFPLAYDCLLYTSPSPRDS